MIIVLVSILISIIPSIIMYKWLKKNKSNNNFKLLCKIALKKGMSSVLIIY